MKFQVLNGANKFFEALRNDVSGAQWRFWCQCLSFEGDTTGKALAKLLCEVDSTLDRRVLVDEYTRYFLSDKYLHSKRAREDEPLMQEQAETKKMFSELVAAGVSVHWTNPIGKKLFRLSARNHKKIFIIDDIAYIGGINFSDHNFEWHDAMLRITDPQWVAALAEDFVNTELGHDQNRVADFETGSLMFFDGKGFGAVSQRLIEEISKTETDIFIQSPYLSEPVFGVLRGLSARGVRVDVIVPAQNNWRPYQDYMDAMVEGTNINLYKFPEMTHLKAMVIDNQKLIFGSNNFDFFGLNTHQELTTVIHDKNLVADFMAQIGKPDIAASTIASKEGRPPWLRAQAAKIALHTGFQLLKFLNLVGK